MAGLKLEKFAGIVPRAGNSLLQDNEAQKANNTKLYSGELQAWFAPGELSPKITSIAGVQSIYKYRNPAGDDIWLQWNTDVNAVPGPIYALAENPLYYTGSGTPKKTNTTLATTGSGGYPRGFLEMGVPTPTSAPSVAVSGGSGTAESRTYIYTYISLFGTIEEESAPSPASSIVSVLPGSTVTISGLPAAAPAGLYNITKVRIYRAVTGSASTVFLKVKDVNIGTTSTTDTVAAANLGGILEAEDNDPPPSDLQGLCAMANGILAGFRGNEIFFSKPNQPHAWPAQYALTVEFPVVGIIALGSSLVVGTQGNPFIISGSTPAAMSQEKLPIYEPCTSKRSMAGDEGGVLYASPNGVVKIAPGFAGLSSRSLFTRDEWQPYDPTTMLGAVLSGRYYLFCANVSENFQGALIFDRNESASPLTRSTFYTTAATVAVTDASLYVAEGGQVKKWEGSQYEFLPYEWLSKLFILPRPLNFGAGQIQADFGDIAVAEALQQQLEAVIAANQALFASTTNFQSTPSRTPPIGQGLIAGSILTPLGNYEIDDRYVNLTVFCEGRQVAVITVKSNIPFRLPSGFKSGQWAFQLNGNIPVRHLKVAETSKELAGI
jgi:hypothetical protein